MNQTPYRERLPRPRTIEVEVQHWAIKQPYDKRSVWFVGGVAGCWALVSLLGLIVLIAKIQGYAWWLVALHITNLIMWLVFLCTRFERRTETLTKTIID